MTVLIAGAGPAGSYLAETLARFEIDVLLVDPLKSPDENIFSSAALPIDAIYEKWIPIESVSTYWNNWRIFSPNGTCYQWKSANNLGVVLDFGDLRRYLWERVRQVGVKLLLGWKVVNVESLVSYANVELVSSNGDVQNIKVDLVIDATGYRRSLLKKVYKKNDKPLTGNGIEWILQGDKASSHLWHNNLTFFLGSNWIKNGYGWIFPMSRNRLKVGVCSLPPYSKLRSNINNLESLILKKGLGCFPVIDRHGGIIRSTVRGTESHYEGRVVGVGDAVSTSNLLGGEGIRHAMTSSSVLALMLIDIIKKNKTNEMNEFYKLRHYQNKLRKALGRKATIANRVAKKTWWGLSSNKSDERIGKILHFLSSEATAKDLSSILFDYNFSKFGIKILPYLLGIR